MIKGDDYYISSMTPAKSCQKPLTMPTIVSSVIYCSNMYDGVLYITWYPHSYSLYGNQSRCTIQRLKYAHLFHSVSYMVYSYVATAWLCYYKANCALFPLHHHVHGMHIHSTQEDKQPSSSPSFAPPSSLSTHSWFTWMVVNVGHHVIEHACCHHGLCSLDAHPQCWIHPTSSAFWSPHYIYSWLGSCILNRSTQSLAGGSGTAEPRIPRAIDLTWVPPTITCSMDLWGHVSHKQPPHIEDATRMHKTAGIIGTPSWLPAHKVVEVLSVLLKSNLGSSIHSPSISVKVQFASKKSPSLIGEKLSGHNAAVTK